MHIILIMMHFCFCVLYSFLISHQLQNKRYSMVESLVIGFLIGLMVIVKTLIDCSIKLDTLAGNAKEIESKLSDIRLELKEISSGYTTFNVQQRPGDSFTIEPEPCATFTVELDSLTPVKVTPSTGSVFEVSQPSYKPFKVKIQE